MKAIFEIQKLYVVKEKSVEYEPLESPMKSSTDIVKVCKQLNLYSQAEEVLTLFCMNANGQIVACHEVSRGDLLSSTSHPREIYKRALESNAASIILVHNHPSGNPTPSTVDIESTVRIAQAGMLMGIPLIDHLILGDGSFISMRAMGLIADLSEDDTE